MQQEAQPLVFGQDLQRLAQEVGDLGGASVGQKQRGGAAQQAGVGGAEGDRFFDRGEGLFVLLTVVALADRCVATEYGGALAGLVDQLYEASQVVLGLAVVTQTLRDFGQQVQRTDVLWVQLEDRTQAAQRSVADAEHVVKDLGRGQVGADQLLLVLAAQDGAAEQRDGFRRLV